MASFWLQMRGEPEKKVAGRMGDHEAIAKATTWAKGWDAKPGCSAEYGTDGYWRLREGTRLAGIAWVEHVSPPSAPEKGQPHRKAPLPIASDRRGEG